MKLLLDTHIWLWSLLDPSRLSPRVRKALAGPDNQLWLSPISVWETLLLHRGGRLELDGEPHAWIESAFRAAPMKEAPITHAIAAESVRVDLPQRDPADRFLAATAIVLHLTLVTADEHLIGHESFRALAN